MSKSTDVTLNIKARNLASKTLDEINGQVEQLAKNNDKQATSAERAARSMSELNAESRQLAGAYRELSRREGLTQSFIEQRKQIGETAAKLQQLTATYREMQKGSGGTLIGFSDADVKRVGREIIQVERDLTRMVASNKKAGDALQKMGIDARDASGSLAQVQQSVARAGAAYEGAQARIAGFGQEQRRTAEIATEAARRQAAAQEQVNRATAEIRRIGRRGGELAELRADIEARSQAARAIEVQGEAARRLAADQAAATAAQERATAAIREAVRAYDGQQARRAQARAAFAAEAVALDRAAAAGDRRRASLLAANRAESESAARKERLAAVLRRLSGETDTNTGALNRNAAASRRAGSDLALFSDVGRKSLGTYQRLRGQILGLTAAYVGFYQVINTAQRAIQATNRNQSLMVGLRTVNNGDAAAAASDYRFLRQEAERLGLVFDDLAPQFANVAISGKALGLNTTQIRDLFTDTATAAAAMNLSVADTEGVFRAMTQIMSKGKVQAEELRGQLGDRLPGAVVMFAKASNIALSDLEQRLKDGTIGIDFLMKGISGYADMYAGEIDTISNRLQGYINRATNSYNDFLRSLLTGANDQKLKDAFQRISDFFRSKDGERFASAVATAFGKLADAFIWAADNLDKVSFAVQAFIAWNLLKFVNDTIIGVVALGGHFKALALYVTGYDRAARVAAVGTATLSARMRGLALMAGPVVAVITALTLGYSYYTARIEKATQRTKDFADALHDLTFAKTEEQLTTALSGGVEELRTLQDEIGKAQRIIDAFDGGALNIGERLATVGNFGLPDAIRSREDAEAALEKRRQRLTLVTQGLMDAQVKLDDAVAARQKQEEKDRLNPLPTLSPTDKGEGGASAKSLRAEENARLNSARAVQKELLNLDQAIFDARVDGEVRTAQQVQQNYQLTVDKIASETEERYLKLQQLAQAAFSAAGMSTPAPQTGDARQDYEAMVDAAQRLGLAEAANLRVAGERVEILRTSLNDRAFEASETQDIEIIERQINDLLDQRNSKVEYYNTLREAGHIDEIDAYNAINATQDGYNQRIAALVQTILPLLQAIGEDDDRFSWAQKLIADMDLLLIRQRQYTLGQRVLLQLGEQFAGGAADAIVALGRGLAGAIKGTNSLSDAFKAARDAFLTFAADFLQQIAQMILQAIILQAIKNAINGTSGGYWGAAMGALAGTNHTGGIVSGAGAGPKRLVDARVFLGAQRFHTGGLPGLRSGEVATILKKGEEVVPEDNPRHVANAGGASEGITQVIATFDPVDVTLQSLGDTRVVKRLLAVFNANSNQVNRSLRR